MSVQNNKTNYLQRQIKFILILTLHKMAKLNLIVVNASDPAMGEQKQLSLEVPVDIGRTKGDIGLISATIRDLPPLMQKDARPEPPSGGSASSSPTRVSSSI